MRPTRQGLALAALLAVLATPAVAEEAAPGAVAPPCTAGSGAAGSAAAADSPVTEPVDGEAPSAPDETAATTAENPAAPAVDENRSSAAWLSAHGSTAAAGSDDGDCTLDTAK